MLLFIYHNFINKVCIPIKPNNPLKTCLSNKKYLITIQTCPTQILKVYFLLKNRVLRDF